MFSEMTIEKFLRELSSKKPTPGGGSAAALAGAVAAGLLSKVAELSGDKETAKKSGRLVKVLSRLIDEDARAFEGVILAYRRKVGIEKSLRHAAKVPQQTARHSSEILKLMEGMKGKAKPSLMSDLKVAVLLARASAKSALLNVEANLEQLELFKVEH